jgi:DNA-binding CsgD family transcriptional regulator
MSRDAVSLAPITVLDVQPPDGCHCFVEAAAEHQRGSAADGKSGEHPAMTSQRASGYGSIEFRQLRYFLAVLEELHFNRAAARLHIAQPTLSRAIRKLEDELGVTLLRRASQTVVPTDAGRVFAEEAEKLLVALEFAVAEARRAGGLGVAAIEDGGSDPFALLTAREIEVLALAADGLDGPELAEQLVLSPATVSTHFKNIYEKLQVRSRAGAVAKAMRLGVID